MMKYTIILILFFLAVTSCNKVVTPNLDFNVTTNSNTYRVGDTVTFNLSGNPNYIVFYSGEFGKQYMNAKRGYLTGGKPTITFTSTVTDTILPDTSLNVLLSLNFTGTNNKAGIAKANWTDVTDRFTLSNGVANTPSGAVDISDLVSSDTVPVTLAFRYRIPPKRKTNWTIQNLFINTIMSAGDTTPIYNLTSGFTAVDSLNSSIKWNVSTNSLFTSGSYVSSAASEDWVVSKPFFPYRTTMDQGTTIKSIADIAISNYQYIFNTAGKYTVTFVAQNANIYDSKVFVKTIELTITP